MLQNENHVSCTYCNVFIKGSQWNYQSISGKKKYQRMSRVGLTKYTIIHGVATRENFEKIVYDKKID